MTHGPNRRDFIKQTTLAGIGAWVAGSSTAAWADDKSPNERLRIACIGVGGKGSSDTTQAGHYGDIVALCDIDDNRLGGMSKNFPKAEKFNDFRKMLDKLNKSIDAVVVSTPDHTHAAASMMAMKMGKHVYCQKPLTYSVHEARAMRETAAKHKVATQMGNQGTALNGLRSAVEIIRSGAIGQVKTVHVWTDRCGGFWRQAPDLVARPTDTPPVPKHVHWDLFLGPAPERPYSPLYHPFAWRGWRDFGTGALGDMACHVANMAFMALKLGYPTSIVAESSEVNPETYQQWATVHYQFPARGDMAPVELVWWEGMKGGNGKRGSGEKNLPPIELLQGEKMTSNGSLFIGEKGTMFCPDPYGASVVLLPRKDFEGYKAPEPTLPRHAGGNSDDNQKKEWVAACKGGPAALSNFEYAGMLTEAMLLGNVAIQAGKKIEWDGPGMKIPNAPEAEKFLGREYRSGWTL